jgi:hypothetical protein
MMNKLIISTMYLIPPLSNYTAMIVTGHPTFVSISVYQE